MPAMLKWEITKTVRRLGWICIGYLLLLCLLWVLPAGAGRIGWMQPLLLTSSTFLALGAFAGMLYPTWNMASYFSKDSYYMEKLTGVPYWKVMLAKLPAGAGELLFMMAAARAGEALMAKFSAASSHGYFSMNLSVSDPVFFLEAAVFVPVMFTFFYLLFSERIKNFRMFAAFLPTVILLTGINRNGGFGWKFYTGAAVLLVLMIWRAGGIASKHYEQ